LAACYDLSSLLPSEGVLLLVLGWLYFWLMLMLICWERKTMFHDWLRKKTRFHA
jgi:hypothetical protein